MKFFSKIKEIIHAAAKEAVLEAEKIFGSGTGALKKRAAIEFVTNALPFPPLVRPIVAAVLTTFIDKTIETAVQALKTPSLSE